MGILIAFCGGCAARAPHVAARTAVKTVLTQPLPENAGREVRVLTVEYPPGGASPAHHHPGAVYVYVVEGTVLCQIDNGPLVLYTAGQAWSEKPGQVHRVARNASMTKPAKLVVFFVTEPGKPVTEMEK
jgi:quercetin dioxygenase-like cupin family protein